jgi:small subunit ribosomal protein S6
MARALRGPGGKGMLMARLYEVMFIARPDLAEEDIDKVVASFSTAVTGGGGAVKSVEKMGRRKLAYTVRKFNDGFYLLFTVDAEGALILELKRRLRVSESVIKFLVVRIDEEEKRLAKVKALRGTRRKASAEPVSAPVAAHTPVAAAPAPVPAPVPVPEPVAPAESAAPVASAEPAAPAESAAPAELAEPTD